MLTPRRSEGSRLDRLLLWWLARPAVVRWVAAAALAAMLWWSSSHPGGGQPPSAARALVHNSMHVVAYATLGGLVWLACRGKTMGRLASHSWVAWLVAVGYGCIDELHQSFVPGRASSFWDVVSDAAGACLGIWLLGYRMVTPRPATALAVGSILAAMVSVSMATFG